MLPSAKEAKDVKVSAVFQMVSTASVSGWAYSKRKESPDWKSSAALLEAARASSMLTVKASREVVKAGVVKETVPFAGTDIWMKRS